MKHMPGDHYIVGMSHNNIGEAHQCLGHYDLGMRILGMFMNIKMIDLLPSIHPNVLKIEQIIKRISMKSKNILCQEEPN